MNKLFFVSLIFLCISTASAINVTNFVAAPDIVDINHTVNISADVFAAANVHTAGFYVVYPNTHTEFIQPSLSYDINSYSMPQPVDYPPNLTGISNDYNITIACKDFSDNSGCYVLRQAVSDNCVNITFDDAPYGGDRDLDIGVIACITETTSGYTINFNRWKYDAGNDVRSMFCLNSVYGVNYCSGWILNNSGCGSTPNCQAPQITITNLNKTIFGGHYLYFFEETSQVGTYHLRFFANDTLGSSNNDSQTFFSVGEITLPRFLSWGIAPSHTEALKKTIISAQVFDESGISYVKAFISGPEEVELQLNENNPGNYSIDYYPPIDGEYTVYLVAEDVFGNQNQTEGAVLYVSTPVTPPSKEACKNVSSLGIMSTNFRLSAEKVNALMKLNYYCAKNILGLWDYDFYIEITDLSGNYVVLNDIMLVYGVYPGKIQPSDILYQVDRTKLGGYNWASPNKVSVQGINAIKNRIASDGRCTEHGCSVQGECKEDSPYCIEYEYALDIAKKITPDVSSYSKSNSNSRILLLDTGQGFKLVKLTIGIWT